MITSAQLTELFEKNMKCWPLAAKNFEVLKSVQTRMVEVNGCMVRMQFNPGRMVSSAAKVDKKTLAERPCFLCRDHRPKEQVGLEWNGKYEILVNPYPIFPKHFTIPSISHVQQAVKDRIGDMLEIAKIMQGYTVFYNGPRCGATAPDHMHFQAGTTGFLPVDNIKPGDKWIYPYHLIMTSDLAEAVAQFHELYASLPIPEGDYEPMMNLICRYTDGQWILYVFPRKKHRPDCYYAEGDSKILVSPASVEVGGNFAIARPEDYEKLTGEMLEAIMKEV